MSLGKSGPALLLPFDVIRLLVFSVAFHGHTYFWIEHVIHQIYVKYQFSKKEKVDTVNAFNSIIKS